MTISLSVPKFIKKPTHGQIAVIGASAFLLIVVVVSLAGYQSHKQGVARAESLQAINAQRQEQREYAAEQAQIGQIKQLEADKSAACSYIKGLATAKATRSLVTLPTAIHCQ